MKREKNTRIELSLGIIAILILILFWHISRNKPYQYNEGMAFSTLYHITYQSGKNYQTQIEEQLKQVDAALSMFNDTSVVAKINRNQPVELNPFFTTVFEKAQRVSIDTHGDFDVTVAPLVNAWGFGFKKKQTVDKTMIDSLLRFVGYNKVKLINKKIIKSDPRMMVDFSAIAKGFGVDVVAAFLQSKGIKDYMVEIGGEVDVCGEAPRKKNIKDRNWRIGINKPIDDSLNINEDLEAILKLTDCGIATSGNYRKFYYKNGKKYAHTINPHTGYPVQHSLLSSTVISESCMNSDAYATSFMVMGLGKALPFLSTHPKLDVLFIYSDKKGKIQTYMTSGMKKLIIKEN